MCPWCYVGHARLERFLSSPAFGEKIAPYMRPTVRLLPFILDPRLPASTYTPPVDHYDKIESTPYEAGNPPSKKEYYGVK